MQSILSKATKDRIKLDPFPYVTIENALDDDLFRRLAETFPSVDVITGGDELHNAKAGLNALDLLENPAVAPVWREFAAHHSSHAFYEEVIALFGDIIDDHYPAISAENGPLAQIPVKRRIIAERKQGHRKDDVVLDCQIMADDTSDARVCRGPHVDAPHEIYAGLIYFRHPDDSSEGGELCVVKAKDSGSVYPAEDAIRVRHKPAELEDDDVEIVAKIPYKANTAIFFMSVTRDMSGLCTR